MSHDAASDAARTRRADVPTIDLTRADRATLAELGKLVPMYEDLAHTAKVHLLQSVVSKILVDMVFSAYFVGLSDQETRRFRQMEELLGSFGTSSLTSLA